MDKLPESIPLVEEWKKATANYNAAKIPLGKFEFGPGDQQVTDSPYAQSAHSGGRNSQQNSSTSLPRSGSQSSFPRNGAASHANGSSRSPIYRPEVDPHLPPGDLTTLSVPSFHNESGNYWFRLQVTFIPDDTSGPAYSLTLYRTYEDFYEFQITLLDTFPYEAGRPSKDRPDSTPPERILPYMPGPVEEDIDDELTEYRREELDAYVRALIELGERGKEYILRHELFRAFFAAKYGDYCEEVQRPGRRGEGEGMEELDEKMGGVRMSGYGNGGGYTNGNRRSTSGGGHSRMKSSSQSHSRTNSGYDKPSLSAGLSQSGHSRGPSSRTHSPLPPIDTSRPSSSGSHAYPSAHIRQPSSTTSHTHNPASTPFSAGPSTASSAAGGGPGGAPAYIKIKIYDRSTDDLIAIRVHPDVNYSELMDKVRARLGSEVRALRYRTGMGSGVNNGNGGGYEELRGDEELRWWLAKEDQKLVLYAEQ